MKRLFLIPALLCAALASPAFANHPGHTDGDRASKREKFCRENPQTCERKREEREDRKKWCADNPKDCQRMKKEREQRREKARKMCEANPEKCEERRTDSRERRKERNGKPDDGRESGPPR